MNDSGSAEAAVVAEGIKVHYEGVRAVDGVDLSLSEGRIMGLIGPNGAGKTTLLNALSGFASLTDGTVAVGGQDVTRSPPHRLLSHGLVRTFQEVATFPALTVYENVELGALGAGLSRRHARRRCAELLRVFHLGAWAEAAASVLPHGQERRLGIARAVAARPRFLLLDEPAAGMDDAESLELADTIVELRDEYGCGVLLVEHDMRVIFRICENIQVLNFGKTMALGPPEEIRTDRQVIAAYLGEEGEFVGLVGHNGAGKTSTLMTIVGTQRPAEGSISYEGQDITRRSPDDILRMGISLVPEGRRIFARLTVGENVRIGGHSRGDRAAVAKDLERLRERFPVLAEKWDRSGGELSGGEQQQLAIARALVSAPRLLLLDEPTLGLAPLMVDRVFEILQELHAEGRTILLVEQNAKRTIEAADRTYVMRSGGQIQFQGTSRELSEMSDFEAAYIGMAGDGAR